MQQQFWRIAMRLWSIYDAKFPCALICNVACNTIKYAHTRICMARCKGNKWARWPTFATLPLKIRCVGHTSLSRYFCWPMQFQRAFWQFILHFHSFIHSYKMSSREKWDAHGRSGWPQDVCCCATGNALVGAPLSMTTPHTRCAMTNKWAAEKVLSQWDAISFWVHIE